MKCAEHLYAPTGSPQTQTSDRNVCALLRDALYLFVWISFCFEVVIRRRLRACILSEYTAKIRFPYDWCKYFVIYFVSHSKSCFILFHKRNGSVAQTSFDALPQPLNRRRRGRWVDVVEVGKPMSTMSIFGVWA